MQKIKLTLFILFINLIFLKPALAFELSLATFKQDSGLSFLTPLKLSDFNFQEPPAIIISDTTLSLSPPLIEPLFAATPTPAILPVTPTPTIKVEPTLTSVPLPTITPTVTPVSIATPSPTIKAGLDAEKLFQMSNDHRISLGLPAFQKDERACALAAARAPEIGAEISGGYMHQGLKDRNLDYWNSENIISMRTEEAAFRWWINDYIHKIAIEGDYKYSCVACSGHNCAQEFTNFQPK